MNTTRQNLIIFLLLMASVVCVSPFFMSASIFKGNILSLICLILVFVLKNGISSKKALLGISILVVFSCFNMVYWNQATIKVAIYFCSALFIVFLLSYDDLFKYTNYLTKLLLLMLVGAIIGFLYALSGGEALFYIANEDTALNGWYLTTFSKFNMNGITRPAGIYDEPGALSFMVCICVALRESLRMKRRDSWILMLAGFVTLSTAHVIFFVLFWMKVKWKNPKAILTSILSLGVSLLLLMSFDNPVNTIVSYSLNRFAIVDGAFVGDNRSYLITAAYSYLDIKTFLFGLDGDCIMGTPVCALQEPKYYCCNPLTLIVHYGAFLSLPYYITLGYLGFKAIQRTDLVILGVLLLLLQRPYVMSYGYALFLVLYVYAIGHKSMIGKQTNDECRLSTSSNPFNNGAK